MLSRRKFLAAACSATGAAMLPGAWAASSTPSRGKREPGEAARDVLRRALGTSADKFHLAPLPAENDRQVFEVSAQNGTVSVRGSSAVALARGAYTYLREAGLGMITWSGQHLALPARLPDLPARRVVCPYQFVQYYNPCTFGYSTAFWDWPRWERELDWMALHGITMPLAMDGQEAIWETVWHSFGVTRAELDRFSVGPAHLPWHRMGNINRLYGPLPPDWIRRKRALQHKILGRMVELEMTPVVPAFAGHVPEAFLRLYPSAKIHALLWDSAHSPGLPLQTKTFFLDPVEAALFQEIGRRFIVEYKRVFGVGEYYLSDSFNELRPPVAEATRLRDLRHMAETIYGGIIAGDPHGKWVMQGWIFAADPEFWTPEATRAFLAGVPDDRMLIIDYPTDQVEQMRGLPVAWRRYDAFDGKRWIEGMLHCFGGNNNVRGDLRFYATAAAKTLADPHRRNLVGWGLEMEGIEQNEVVYELLTDVGWSDRAVDLETWIPRYCLARYGGCPDDMREAWRLLLQSAYAPGGYRWNSWHAFQKRPSLRPKARNIVAGPEFQRAVDHFVACGAELGNSELYRNDLVELVAQAAGGLIDARLAAACAAHEAGNLALRTQAANEALAWLARLDAWVDLRPDRRLTTWTMRARSWAEDEAEAAYYDSNARCLVTFWGWKDLEEYATRVWSGLIGDYFRERWRWFFQNLPAATKLPPDADTLQALDEWEQAWLSAPYHSSPVPRIADPIAEAQALLRECRSGNVS